MCGIGGVFPVAGGTGAEELKNILSRIAHRGHSKFESHEFPTCSLGANRLAIVDRENGRQPKFSSDSSVAVVFNGEIYNHKELLRELIDAGYNLQSKCDTEVLVNGFHLWGKNLFERLDGMFAAIFYDLRNGQVTAVRDPAGVKPLYYLSNDRCTYFSSEIKSLIQIGSSIEQVLPGHYWIDGVQKPYLPSAYLRSIGSLEQEAGVLKTEVSASVKKRTRTDLPVAVFLSGGIDSSVILYEALRYHKNITAFSIGKRDASDVLAAKMLCDELHIPIIHRDVDDNELIALIPETIATIESFEPNHIRGGTLSYLLSKEASERGFKIALCGEGADELFGGYKEFGLALLEDRADFRLREMFQRFYQELYMTQLQRVDRTAMRFTLEMREPFLDKAIVAHAFAIPTHYKVIKNGHGRVIYKRILREAYRNILPDYIVDREKMVLSYGAGVGSNGPEGIFYEYANRSISDNQLNEIKASYPDFALSNKEEAYYYSIYRQYFGDVKLGTKRPLVNRTSV